MSLIFPLSLGLMIAIAIPDFPALAVPGAGIAAWVPDLGYERSIVLRLLYAYDDP